MANSRPTGRALHGAALAYPGLFVRAVQLPEERREVGGRVPAPGRGRSDPGALAFAGGVPEPHEGMDPGDAEQGPENRIERR
jgi:hypothetical protein